MLRELVPLLALLLLSTDALARWGGHTSPGALVVLVGVALVCFVIWRLNKRRPPVTLGGVLVAAALSSVGAWLLVGMGLFRRGEVMFAWAVMFIAIFIIAGRRGQREASQDDER